MSQPPSHTWVSLISGCSSGIGLALAQELRGRGQRCFATARQPQAVEQLARQGFEALRLDVTDTASIAAAVETITSRAGRIDLLVNNAGQSLFGPLADVPLARVDALLATNLRGPLALAQAVIPVMARQGWGRIANIGSMVGVVPTPFAGAYCASKAGLHMLSEVLRMEVEPFGIEVMVVQPGAVRSEVANNAPVELAAGSLYAAIVDQIRQRARASQDQPTETDAFARALADALLHAPAPRTIRLGRGVGFIPLLVGLPGRLRDRMLARRFGLDTLKGV